jgi:hypothetical protein
MTSAMLAFFFAGICLTAFVTLWFYVSFRELSAKRKSLYAISEQVQLHRILYMQERGGEHEAAARNIFENKLMVYSDVEKDYYALLKRPMHLIPGCIMGFSFFSKALLPERKQKSYRHFWNKKK